MLSPSTQRGLSGAPVVRSIELPNGPRLDFVEQGDPSGVIVWGDHDALFLRHHREALAAGIPGSRLVIYSGTGHAVHWEEPQRFVADLVQFVDALVK
jgi:pimeloyl-ACP methyl ester carboxylesterase